jgi:hypothetical protein
VTIALYVLLLFQFACAVVFWRWTYGLPRAEMIPHVDVLRPGDRVCVRATLSGGGTLDVCDVVSDVGPHWVSLSGDDARSHRFGTIYQAQIESGAVTVERAK